MPMPSTSNAPNIYLYLRYIFSPLEVFSRIGRFCGMSLMNVIRAGTTCIYLNIFYLTILSGFSKKKLQFDSSIDGIEILAISTQIPRITIYFTCVGCLLYYADIVCE